MLEYIGLSLGLEYIPMEHIFGILLRWGLQQ